MRYQLGLAFDTNELNAIRSVYAYLSLSSCARYISKFNNLGHFRSMLKTGNHEAKRAVRGQSLVYLAMFRLVNPAASIDGVRAYLHNMDPAGVPFRPAAVVHAEHLLGLRRKASSMTCQRAFPP